MTEVRRGNSCRYKVHLCLRHKVGILANAPSNVVIITTKISCKKRSEPQEFTGLLPCGVLVCHCWDKAVSTWLNVKVPKFPADLFCVSSTLEPLFPWSLCDHLIPFSHPFHSKSLLCLYHKIHRVASNIGSNVMEKHPLCWYLSRVSNKSGLFSGRRRLNLSSQAISSALILLLYSSTQPQ